MYRPKEAEQMATPCLLQQPVTAKINGVNTKTFTDVEGIIMANFKTYGGTERESDGLYIIEDTANIVCWYRPDITSGCRIVRLADGKNNAGQWKAVFEIVGEPENIEMRNMLLTFKVKRVKGGA